MSAEVPGFTPRIKSPLGPVFHSWFQNSGAPHVSRLLPSALEGMFRSRWGRRWGTANRGFSLVASQRIGQRLLNISPPVKRWPQTVVTLVAGALQWLSPNSD